MTRATYEDIIGLERITVDDSPGKEAMIEEWERFKTSRSYHDMREQTKRMEVELKKMKEREIQEKTQELKKKQEEENIDDFWNELESL